MVTKKANTPAREARRRYEEKHKEERRNRSGNFQTMIPKEDYDEITAFLKEKKITKVELIFAGYVALKSRYENNKQGE